MNIKKLIIKNAKAKSDKWIVLPEASLSKEILNAGLRAVKQKICNIILLGDDSLKKYQNEKVKIINIATFEHLPEMQKFLFELRKEKGMTLSEAKKLLKDPNYFGVVLVKMGYADGMVSGKIAESKNVIKPALQIIKGRECVEIVSSFMLMLGRKQNYIFADCGLIKNPTAQNICDIAISSANSAKNFLFDLPKVALLSYATHKSADGESVNLVNDAVKILKQKKVKFDFDGPIQADAAINKKVAKVKAQKSKIAGFSNVLIFPSLDAGNIGYKLYREGSNCLCVGPILQGLSKPINDLSRGATESEILFTIAITVLQID